VIERFAIVGIVLASLAATACAPDENEAVDYISRFGGPERRWTPRLGLPVKPQKRPAMLIYEVSRFPDAVATEEQRMAAEAFREASMLAAVQNGWYDFEVAARSGYQLMFSDDAHYVNEEYVFDDVVLDPTRPEFLMYYRTSRGMSLVGFMFYVADPSHRGEQLGGPLTTWHFHVWSRPQCLLSGLLAVDVPNLAGECARGEPSVRSPEMLHVWLVDHPEGPFATRMRIAPEVLERLITARGF